LAEVDPDIPTPLQFNHVLTFLPIGADQIWLDSTVGVAPFGYLAPQLRGQQTLLVDAAPASELRKTPLDFPFAVEYRIRIDGTVDALGTLDATVELQTRSDLEVLIRILNDHVSKDQLAKTADTLLARTNKFLYDSVRYTDFKVVNASDIADPVRTQFHLVGRLMYVNPKESTPAQLAVALTSRPIDAWHLLTLLLAATKPDSNGKPQPLPIQLKGPKSYSLTLNLAFAVLAGPDSPPAKEFRITQPFAEYASSDLWKGNTLQASRSLELRSAAIPSGDSKEYAAFVQKIVEAVAVPPAPAKDRKVTVASNIPISTPASTISQPSNAAHGSGTKADAPSTKNDGGTIASSFIPALSSASEPAPQPITPAYLPSAQTTDIYKRGEEEAKRKHWANAIEAFGSAVKADPQYPDAWRELGRAHMYERQYPEAEAAFRKYLELAPNDRLAYLNMAWALSSQRKFEEEEALLLKRVADAPKDGDALFRLGAAYLGLYQPEKAVPFLERSVGQFPKYVLAQIALGRAYLGTHQDSLALASFRTVLTLDDSEKVLNTLAYALAENKSSLDIAEDWSQRSIDVVETELNDSSLSNIQSQTWSLVVTVGQYWDTMGWIKFQQGKMDSAEKYTFAAWQLTGDQVIATHLGRIYETQGRKNDAIDMYLDALNILPSDRLMPDNAKETRKRLLDILGSDSDVDARLEQSRRKNSPLRTVTIENAARAQGIAQYLLIIGANSKILDLAAAGTDDPLASLNDAVRVASIPQPFPDTKLKKLPRLSTLTCLATNQPCVLTLVPANAVSRLLPLD
jgi:tetratricopeptide (TPR) repeat protein